VGWVAPRCIRGGYIPPYIRTHGSSVRPSVRPSDDVGQRRTSVRRSGSAEAPGEGPVLAPCRAQSAQPGSQPFIRAPRVSAAGSVLPHALRVRDRAVKVILPGVKATRTPQKRHDFIAVELRGAGGGGRRSAASRDISGGPEARGPGVRQAGLAGDSPLLVAGEGKEERLSIKGWRLR
jgi:hypothetical protein